MPIVDKLPFGSSLTSARASKTRIAISYIFDYAIIIVLLGAFLMLDKIEPYHQEFSLHNYTLQYKFAVHERIPNALLVALAIGSPLVIIIFWTLVVDGLFSHKAPDGRKRKYSFKDRLWELNCGLLGLALSIGLQYVIVGSLKNAIGKPRPDMIDRCKPKEGSADPLPFGLSNYTICTQTDSYIMNDGFKSFPSGHSSTAFGGLFYLSLYLCAKLHALDSRGEAWKLFVVLTPSLGAALIAGSRIMDARHHPFDVITGSLLGITFAWAAYRQYFPPLHDFRAKGRAYPIRSWGREPLGKRDDQQYDNPFTSPNASEEDRIGLTTGSAMRLGSPPHGSGNVFRDELSQRGRAPPGGFPPPQPAPSANPFATGDIAEQQHQQQRFGAPVGASIIPSAATATAAAAGAPQRRPLAREDSWDDVNIRDGHTHSSSDGAGDTSPDGYELQPQYTLSQPSGQTQLGSGSHMAGSNAAMYDPYHTSMDADSSYRGATSAGVGHSTPGRGTPVGRLPSMRSPQGQRVFPPSEQAEAPPVPRHQGGSEMGSPRRKQQQGDAF